MRADYPAPHGVGDTVLFGFVEPPRNDARRLVVVLNDVVHEGLEGDANGLFEAYIAFAGRVTLDGNQVRLKIDVLFVMNEQLPDILFRPVNDRDHAPECA